MNKFDLLKIYSVLPYPLRMVAATLRGLELRSWRFGPETDRLVEVAKQREAWSHGQWQAWQQEQLAGILHHAAKKVPYYRDQWEARRRKGDYATWEVLENWPVLSKQELRAHNRAFLAEDCEPTKMFCDHTSGTTGTPLSIWMKRETVRAWYALFEARWRGWYGLSRRDRWAILGGQLVAPITQVSPPFWVWNHALNQLYLSAYHIESRTAAEYVRALEQHEVTYVLSYPSAIATLAQLMLQQGLSLNGIRCVISNAEPLYTYQREYISQALGCPVYDTYGLSEIVIAASECHAGNMHIWPEAGLVEVLAEDADEHLEPGQNGRLVCTGLINADMPLIRYDTGDSGAMRSELEVCGCGRRLPMIAEISGRTDDMIISRDGRKVGRLDPIFKADFHILEAQITQETLDLIRVRLVPATGYTDKQGEEISDRLRQRVGDINVIIDLVESIPRTKAGKFNAVISKLKE